MIHMEWYFGRIGFSVYILAFCHCSSLCKENSRNASPPDAHPHWAPSLQGCPSVSLSLAYPSQLILRPEGTGTVLHSPSQHRAPCRVHTHLWNELSKLMPRLPLSHPFHRNRVGSDPHHPEPELWCSCTVLSPPSPLEPSHWAENAAFIVLLCTEAFSTAHSPHNKFLLFGLRSKALIKLELPTFPFLHPMLPRSSHQL